MKLINKYSEEGYRIIGGNVKLGIDVRELCYSDAFVMGYFDCSLTNITSLEGSPVKVKGNVITSHTKITSLEGCPRDVGQNFYANCHAMINLKNVHKYIDRIGENFLIPITIESHILGILKIRDVKSVVGAPVMSDPLFKAMAIINHYIKDKPNPMKRDIHGCQIEMIESGLEAYAQL